MTRWNQFDEKEINAILYALRNTQFKGEDGAYRDGLIDGIEEYLNI
jgi:hypothetical protein